MYETRFSVVIPTHNGEAYIGQAIESVISQTYTHFEIVVLEHESTDRTLEICRGYNDPRIRIQSTKQPQTIESNWGRILDLQLAEYLTILGHDDIFYPEFLQEIASLIGKEPDASLYFSHFHIIDSDGAIIRPCKPSPYRESGEAFMQARQQFQRDSFGTGYVMRTADFKSVGGFRPFPRLIFADDFCFYELAALAGKVCSPHYLFGYRYHRKSEAYLSGLDTLAEASQQLINALAQTPYATNPANMTLANDYVTKTFTRRYIRILINLMKSNDRVKFDHYHQIRADFLRHFPRYSTSIYDVMAGIIELLFRLPFSGLRIFISNTLQYLVKITRGIKD